ncbi:hypothetical protein E4T52_04026 [Aureobasidium sp. EXF-3400]|nr:hypothetical protein E4T51_04495 [Aureobasidium sp. EXF-12344]KAI4781073.1 hypothetical protein E4T52_04026 [Aureobasidium sp. EXF-3400]
MDIIAQSDFVELGIEDTYYPDFVIDKPAEAPSMQDSAYSSPRPSSSWFTSETMSDSCSNTWSSPTPSIAYSPSPRPDFGHHYSTWSQVNAGHGMQNQVQCQPNVYASYRQEAIPQPYYHPQYYRPGPSEEQSLDTLGIGGWTDIEYSQPPCEQILESSSIAAPVIVSSDDSPKQHSCPLIKQEEPAEHHYPCPNSSTRKEQANKAKTAYPCPFLPYGCPASFSSKNEWKRHLNTQHLSLSTYRCDLCIPKPSSSSSPQQTNDFNRKDLFIQHLRHFIRVYVNNLQLQNSKI